MRAFGVALAMALLAVEAASAEGPVKTLASEFGLRGKVKECTEERSFPAQGSFPGSTVTTVQVFSSEGRVMEIRSGDSVTTYKYDAKGNLLAVNEDAVAKDGERSVLRFPEPEIEPGSNVAMSAVTWEGSDLQFQMPPGGTLTTVYDDKGRPAQAEIAAKNGVVTGRITRQYDDKGRIVGEKLRPENIDAGVKAMAGNIDDPRLNEAQKKTLGEFMAMAFAYGESGYRYDARGRLTEKHLQTGIWGDTVTKLQYNEQGDVSEEDSTQRQGKGMSSGYGIDDEGNLVAQGPKVEPKERTTKLRYRYEYDAKGNWTEKTTLRLENGEYVVSGVEHRKLTYYE